MALVQDIGVLWIPDAGEPRDLGRLSAILEEVEPQTLIRQTGGTLEGPFVAGETGTVVLLYPEGPQEYRVRVVAWRPTDGDVHLEPEDEA